MPFLRRSAYLTLEHRVASRLLCFVRTALAFEEAATARAEITEWQRCVDRLEPAELSVLFDWRSAPLETNADVLRAVVSRTDAIGRLFARQALLMETSLGALQASRLSRAHESVPVLFTNEAEAYAYVTSR
jgi:hypothetical protein